MGAVAAAFREHELATYTAALAFRVLVSLVPLTLLGLALLNVLGLEDTWRETLAPPLRERFTAPVFAAMNFSVVEILTASPATLIALASALLLWHMTRGMRTVMDALSTIHGVQDKRSGPRRLVLAFALAVAVAACLVAAALVMTAGSQLSDSGLPDRLLSLLRWPVAILLLAAAVHLLLRFAPAEHSPPAWASTGSALIVGSWLLFSIAFSGYLSEFATFRTAPRLLTAFLVLTVYVFVSCAIFLVGAELDELARKGSDGRGRRR